MAPPEFVTPVLTVVGVPALIFVILRSLPRVANAVVVVLAGIIAIVTHDKDRRDSCHKVLDRVTRSSSRYEKPDEPRSPNPGSGP
jgi:hypothetical protein